MSGAKHHRGRSRIAAVIIMAVVATLLPGALLNAAQAAPGSHVSVTFEGCRGTFGGSFPITGPFVCPDAEYTTGNLGKGWHELDLVPHRLTTSLGTQNAATTDYTVNITADNCEFEAGTGFTCANGASGRPGYDVISVPVKNPASHSSCSVAAGAQMTKVPGIGGTDVSIYRTLSIHQNKGTTCVFDYYQRLALGARLYPGASLHSNTTQEDFSTGGIGARDVSIPVKDIAPQSIAKTMTATQGASHSWSLSKTANPVNLTFENTCSDATGARQAPVTITVTWTKNAADPNGPITVVTMISATNPAHRPINVQVTDTVYSGTTQVTPLTGSNPVTSAVVTVPANTSGHPILTHTITVAAGTTNLNDVAVATYTDPVPPHVPIPGTTTATASATPTVSSSADNATAVITDSESITGTGLTFSVATPSVGSFTGGYVAGTPTTGPVGWNSGTQSGSGSVTFNKTVYVDQPRNTTGTLSDTASLTASEGATAGPAVASTNITANALFELVISKTIPNILQGSDTASFTFDVCPGTGCTLDGNGAATNAIATRVIGFTAGQTGPKTASVSGLAAGSYKVHERPAAGWNPQSDQTITFSSPSSIADCTKTASFANTFAPARVKVQKFTQPTGAGQEAGWTFTLTGPGIGGSGEPKTTTDSAPATPGSDESLFDKLLDEGTYTITETLKSGWQLIGIAGKIDDVAAPGRYSTSLSSRSCSFTVNYPADIGSTFECEFTNRQLGSVSLTKTVNGATPDASESFSFELRPQPSGTALPCTANSGNSFSCTWNDIVPGDYKLCEINVPAGSTPSAPGLTFTLIDATTGTYCSNTFAVGAGASLSFTVDNRRPEGGQRTIGYWKNHASCSRVQKGQQLDEFLPITIGDVNVTTCEKAVEILSNPSMKYAEHGTAAQLLAAKLNVAAGAGTCAAVTNAINAADGLLGDSPPAGIDWNGSPTTSIVGSKHLLRTQFNTAHGSLDTYNNGLLC